MSRSEVTSVVPPNPPTDINERLLTLFERQQATMQQQVDRSAPKENPHYKANSIFLQENGEPWAKKLKCDIYLGSISFNDSPLTKDEVDALNQMQPLARGTITKNDGSSLIVTVSPKTDAGGHVERLTIVPYTPPPLPGRPAQVAQFEKNLNLLMPSIISMAKELSAQAMVPA